MKINISPKQWHVSSKTIFYMFLLLMVIPLFNGFALLTGDGGLHSPYYFVGYSTGFGARKLLGTIFSFILPEYTTHRHLVPYIWCVLLAIFFVVRQLCKCLVSRCQFPFKQQCVTISAFNCSVCSDFLQRFVLLFFSLVR